MIKKTIPINGTAVSFWVSNPECESTMVLIHGFRGNHKALTDFAHNFKDHCVILLDLPGYGVSEPMRLKHTLQNYAKFIDSFATQLNLTNFTLVGHSYGAAMCVLYAAKHPQALKNLVLICPAISTNGLASCLMGFYYGCTYLLPVRWQKRWLTSKFLDQMGGRLLIKKVSKHRRDELTLAGCRNLSEVKPLVVVESLLSYQTANIYYFASRIKIPTLIIAGALDQIVPLEKISKLEKCIKQSELIISKDHGHLAPLEQPQFISRVVEDFLNFKVKLAKLI